MPGIKLCVGYGENEMFLVRKYVKNKFTYLKVPAMKSEKGVEEKSQS